MIERITITLWAWVGLEWFLAWRIGDMNLQQAFCCMHLSNGWLSKFFCLYNFAFADDHKVDSSIALVLLEDVQ